MTAAPEPMRVLLMGAGRRANYLYAPLMQALADEVELVAVWGHRAGEQTRALAARTGVPFSTDLARLVKDTEPTVAVVSVASHAQASVAHMAIEHGLHVLIETPIATTLAEADTLIDAAKARQRKIEVAEQFHRRPPEELKRKLIALGLFGEVYTSFSDFHAARVHGISMMRSYLGFNARPVQVLAVDHTHELAAHWSRLQETRARRTETQVHALITFAGGRTGVYHWSSVGYDSPLRWWRSTRFLAEKGMGISMGMGWESEDRLSLLAPGGEAPYFMTLERRWERVPGGALEALVAHTGDPQWPIVRWDNPFRSVKLGDSRQWHDEWIAVIGCLMSLVNAVRNGGDPTYGAQQARLDLELTLAIRQSVQSMGAVVKLPFV